MREHRELIWTIPPAGGIFQHPATLLFRVPDRRHRAGESQKTLPLIVFERQQEVGLFGMHQAKAQKRFFTAFFFIVPHRIDQLNFVQLADRHHVVAKIRIADDHVEHTLPAVSNTRLKRP